MMEREFLITWSIRDRDMALQEIGSIISNLAECNADSGNGGYYYSVCSIRVNGIDYKVVEV